MNWEAIGAIGETVGAIAVVVSLFYLSIQIRRQNHESKAASVHDICEGYRSITAEMMQPSLAKVWLKSLNGYDNMDDAEKVQFISFCLVCFKLFEEAYYQLKAGRLDNYIWEGMVAQLSSLMGTGSMPLFGEIENLCLVLNLVNSSTNSSLENMRYRHITIKSEQGRNENPKCPLLAAVSTGQRNTLIQFTCRCSKL